MPNSCHVASSIWLTWNILLLRLYWYWNGNSSNPKISLDACLLSSSSGTVLLRHPSYATLTGWIWVRHSTALPDNDRVTRPRSSRINYIITCDRSYMFVLKTQHYEVFPTEGLYLLVFVCFLRFLTRVKLISSAAMVGMERTQIWWNLGVRLTQQWVIRDHCVHIYTETWSASNILDRAFTLDGGTLFRADRTQDSS